MDFAQVQLAPFLHHYGAWGLCLLLALGIVGLPIPDESLLMLSGYFVAKGYFALPAVIASAYVGSCLGITVSYFIGRFIGYNAILYFGKYIGISKEKLDIVHDWFQRFGKYLLLITYFIPGVRHLSGITAGTSKLRYSTFAVFAYAGAIFWSSVFLFLGYFFFGHSL